MNKNLHRIVFNAKRGLRMAVAETATAQGKDAGGDAPGVRRSEALAAKVMETTFSALTFAVLSAMGAALWVLNELFIGAPVYKPDSFKTANSVVGFSLNWLF